MPTEEKILESILLRPGFETENSEILMDMISDCIAELRDAVNYREDEDIPESLHGVVKELVCMKFNQDGSQGIQSESQSSGGSVTYLDDIPKPLRRRIYKYRRLRK